MKFNPSRLAIARKRRLLNQKELAEAIGAVPLTISRCENGSTQPALETVEAIARVLDYPVAFFFAPEMEEPEEQTTSFRCQTSMSAAVRNAALSAGSLAFEICDWVEGRFNLPSGEVPDLSLFSPEEAARTLRQEWGLGEKPISNMVHLLESRGVRVFSLAENTVKVNAYSLWRNGRPFVFLNTFMSAERSRFDAAHELGHLVIHQDAKNKGREAEDQAQQFASSFLMPKADVLARLQRIYDLRQLVEAKRRWRVSLAALAYRVHKLGLISDWKYRDFCIELGQRGYRSNEPETIERERSLVWKKVLEALWQEQVTKQEIAKQLLLPEDEVEGLLFGIVNNNAPSKHAFDGALRVFEEDLGVE